MKTGLRKYFFSANKRWLPLLLFIVGSGIQIAGKWLPTLVICYKANEKPKIEFMYDVCDCRKECTDHSLPDHNECSTKYQSSCLDVPLTADQGYGPIPRILCLQGSQFAAAHKLFTDPLPHFLFPPTPEVGLSPPRSERTENGFGLFFQTGRIDALLCRFRC